MLPQDCAAAIGQILVPTNPHGFLIADFMAFCEVESSFNASAYRYEPRLREASYGLMQMLLSTAQDRGFKGIASELTLAKTNLTYGIAQVEWIADYLKGELGREPSKSMIAGAYNAGVGNALKGFVVKAYLSEWTEAQARWFKIYLTS